MEKFRLLEDTVVGLLSLYDSNSLSSSQNIQNNQNNQSQARSPFTLSKKQYKQLSCIFNDIYNLTCDTTEYIEMLVVSPITCIALKIMIEFNEGNDIGCVFMEACCLVASLFSQFDTTNLIDMELKHRIEVKLISMGLIEILLTHMKFWAVEWEGKYGDCALPIFQAVAQLMLSSSSSSSSSSSNNDANVDSGGDSNSNSTTATTTNPTIIELIRSVPEIVSMIHIEANRAKSNYNGAVSDGIGLMDGGIGSPSVIMSNLLNNENPVL